MHYTQSAVWFYIIVLPGHEAGAVVELLAAVALAAAAHHAVTVAVPLGPALNILQRNKDSEKRNLNRKQLKK